MMRHALRGRIDEEKIDHAFEATLLIDAPEKRKLCVRDRVRTARGIVRAAESCGAFAKSFHSRAERSGVGRTRLQAREGSLPLRRSALPGKMLEESVPPTAVERGCIVRERTRGRTGAT